MIPGSGQVAPQVAPPPSSMGPTVEGKRFYAHVGSTFIYSDGVVEVFREGGNLITNAEKIRQLDTVANNPSGLIHTRGPAETEVLVRPEALRAAAAAIAASEANARVAAVDPKLQALMDKAKQAAAGHAAAQPPVPSLGAVTTADVAVNAANSNSGVSITKA